MAILNWVPGLGEAPGYEIDEKPADATHVVMARDANGTVIQMWRQLAGRK
ncbi:hypothetical protein SAMN05216403_1286 [Nitrosospira multiformis ATCC 25196]|uniref:Uncharacterized protein n=1 Tax=Nitrosospira multiformis (strain ATCC 25196 / NCIMB 11849 / C 71) TaxID=323848 RepID=A0A1H5X998_NITMU|nr:hypothetical protein [Nitrosospira multiformis]SEG08213.1 hypothetical protein SAMN05216403_1286 [Nitrosospira multiformis ATCC 25196]